MISCDNITTFPSEALGPQIGMVFEPQEQALGRAIRRSAWVAELGSLIDPARFDSQCREALSDTAAGGYPSLALRPRGKPAAGGPARALSP